MKAHKLGLVFILAVALLQTGSIASPAKEPSSWKLIPAKSMSAWHVSRSTVGFAAVVELPNLCWRAKVKRDIPVDPRAPQVYEVVGGAVTGQMCGMVVVECAVRSVPEFVRNNFVVGKDSTGSRRVRIGIGPPSLPKTCPK